VKPPEIFQQQNGPFILTIFRAHALPLLPLQGPLFWSCGPFKGPQFQLTSQGSFSSSQSLALICHSSCLPLPISLHVSPTGGTLTILALLYSEN